MFRRAIPALAAMLLCVLSVLAVLTVLSTATFAVPAAARSAAPVPGATVPAATTAPPCVVTPVLPRLVVADTHFVQRTFVLRTTCRLQAPAVFSLTYGRSGFTAGSAISWAGDHGVVGDGAQLSWRAQSDFVAFGAYTLTPVRVRALSGRAVTVRRAGLSIKARTRSTLVIGRLGAGHTAGGTVTSFNGYRMLTTRRPVLLQWRDGSRWAVVRELRTAADGTWTTVLPRSRLRTYRALAPALSSATAASSPRASCGRADRRLGGC